MYFCFMLLLWNKLLPLTKYYTSYTRLRLSVHGPRLFYFISLLTVSKFLEVDCNIVIINGSRIDIYQTVSHHIQEKGVVLQH